MNVGTVRRETVGYTQVNDFPVITFWVRHFFEREWVVFFARTLAATEDCLANALQHKLVIFGFDDSFHLF